MIVSLFRRTERETNRRIVDAIFERTVAAARQPVLYADWGMPDTPLGRYESVALHMIVLMHRTRAQGPQIEALAQEVLDEFFKDVDHSIRELGVGDLGVPKRMKKLARMFYGRMGAYWQAIDDDDPDALAIAIRRNVMPDDPASERLAPAPIAAYMIASARHLATQDNAALLAGRIDYLTAGPAP
ncbi:MULTISPECIES: ubiquinol-cytochrome C chaperone family protein [unclassified Roseitalea]|uniref:ubiquinol-cytochrome C chaperone family protein n=1 Tax=unclassified Roseitalea TaxID=2639107 RepID=UPI00273E0E14|nr:MULTISPECIES: ubiquinol-cytochrome C chaperone family protein [unclassified Roseitalea]